MKLRWMIGISPIFMYCAICRATIFYPLSHRLFGTNLCFKHGWHLEKPKIKRHLSEWLQQLPCIIGLHKWICDGGVVGRDKQGYTFLCAVCRRRKYTWLSPKEVADTNEKADKIAKAMTETFEELKADGMPEKEANKAVVDVMFEALFRRKGKRLI